VLQRKIKKLRLEFPDHKITTNQMPTGRNPLIDERIQDLIVIGGGAAGFFGAIEFATLRPGGQVLILEKSTKILSKVKVSGGGRCNVTHNCDNPFELARHYPRGNKALKSMFREFAAADMIDWLARRKVELHAESDGRMFPITNDSQTIIDCFVNEAKRLNVRMILSEGVENVARIDGTIVLRCRSGATFKSKSVLIATGGNAAADFYGWIGELDHHIRKPIPSLFTFNEPTREFADLMGLSVECADVRIEGTKFREKGPVLITHWGLSGPAIIRLSAWGAEYLYEKNYQFRVVINWTGTMGEDEMKIFFEEQRKARPRQKIVKTSYFGIPLRLWERLCLRSDIAEAKVWGDVNNRSLNKLQENLIRCGFAIAGKTTFKEEFVTCGGVELDQVHVETLESKRFPGVFFAGEVLNIDGETGGFNFQAAWTTAYLAARGVIKYLETNDTVSAPR
jgi:predicted Rossmann fold flavoprotein